MPLYKTSTSILDRAEPLEVVLELLSFAGGENTIGEDQELSSNEARAIDNWDAISLGGMTRSKGFSLLAAGQNHVDPVAFTGTGLNDATAGGTYSGTSTATFTVIIDSSAASPDTFKWKKGSGAYTNGVVITFGVAQVLSDGVTITFAAADGHTLNDQWTIRAVSYTAAPDLLLHHYEGSNVRNYAVIAGDLLKINGANIQQTDIGAFTSGVLCHGVTAGSKAWITNSTDNLKYTTIAGAVTVPTTVPGAARERIYYHKQRLIAEGGGVTVYGSRVGSGNWAGAGGWSTSGDSWSIDMPDVTKGCAPAWPNGDVVTVFTAHSCYTLYNFPNIAYKPVQSAHGCASAYSIAQGVEGLFFLSQYPTLGVFLWDNSGTLINLTVHESWVSDVVLTNRIFSYYRENEYGILYNELGSGVSYPNVWRIYDTKFGVWKKRSINTSVVDNFGYPAILEKPSNVLAFSSSRKSSCYTMQDTSNSDNSYATSATYKTKDFTSKDFRTTSGGAIPIDEVRMKLLKSTVTYYGTTGEVTLQWTADRGEHVGSRVIGMASSVGDLINTTFTVDTSSLVAIPPSKTVTYSFSNSAIGRRFSFDINNIGIGERPKIRKIKIFAQLLEEA